MEDLKDLRTTNAGTFAEQSFKVARDVAIKDLNKRQGYANAWLVYKQATALAQQVLDEVTAPAQKEYQEAIDLAVKTYKKTIANLRTL